MKNQRVFSLLRKSFNKSLLILLCILTWQLSAFAQTLKADYQFQGNLTSSVGTAPAMTNLTGANGSNTFVTDTVDGYSRQTLRFPSNSGVQVQTFGLIPSDSYTVSILFRFDDVTGSRRRLLDTKNRGDNCGSYILNSLFEFEPTTTPMIYPNTYIQATIVRTAGGQVRIYRDGILRLNFSSDNGCFIIASQITPKPLNFFQDDLIVNNEASAGNVARIRLYDAPMTTAQVQALDRTPNANGGGDQSLLFYSVRDGNSELYSMNNDGTNQLRLTNNSSTDFYARWSPDKSKIVFTRREISGAPLKIWVMNADGSGQTQLTNAVNDQNPSWSPDGSKILFSRCDANFVCNLYTMQPDGLNQTEVPGVNTSRDEDYASYSPDGSKIVFSRDSILGTYNIYTVNANGSNEQAITNDTSSPIANVDARFSPDGSKIVWLRLNNPANEDTWEVFVNTGIVGLNTNLTNNNVKDYAPNWSPNGASIAYSSRRDIYDEIYTMNSSSGGSNVRLTTNSALDTLSDWYRVSTSCSYSLNINNANVAAAGGNGSFNILTTSNCAWTATSNAAWVTTSSSGSGNGTINYTVAANTGAARSGTITVGGQTFTVNQAAGGGTSTTVKLSATDGGIEDQFGASVAISGDTMVVAAPFDDINGNFDQGSVYVFVRNGANWTQQAKLIANDGASDVFGNSVAISGDRIIVGSPNADISGVSNKGAAYIFVRNGTTWTQQQKLFQTDGVTENQFGVRVSISGDTAIVGAWKENVAANSAQGSAYIFVNSGGTWTQQAKIFADDGAAVDRFATATAISGDTIIIGTALDDVGANSDQGSAYIFVRNGVTWTQQSKLTAADGAANDSFGYGVSLFGNTAIVGAYLDDVGANSNQGSAYSFTQSGTNWTQQSRFHANDGEAEDKFGVSVAISANTIVVGASGDDIGSNSNQGAIYVFSTQIRKANSDFDGDGKTDLSIFRPAPGEWWVNRSSDGGNFATQFGASTDKIVPVDFTGDGKTDVAFWRPSSGQWFILRSEDSSFYAFPFGANGDVPVPADYDGDGKADAAVFRESSLTWFINKSGGGTDIIGFGATGDKPTVADYDGDGKADIAIFRPNGATGGEWWIRRSSNGSVLALQFGNSTDKPVQGDFTGDGKAEVAFWRPSNGNWFILRSEDFSFYAFPFGASGDIPVAGDYDGDGKFDAGVFRPSNSTWFINRSTAGTLIQQFGISGDLPTPSAFVP